MDTQNYSAGIIGPDEDEDQSNNEPVMSTEEFLDILNRDEMTEFFLTVDNKGYRKAIKAARKLIKKFILEDTKLSVLRAFFILCIFNLTDYKFIREMYQVSVRMAPISQVKLTDIYHASMILEGNSDFDKNIEALAPYVREIVTKMAEDIKRVRLNINT